MLLQRYRQKTEITVKDVYSCKRSYRANQGLVEELFALAEKLGAGYVSGAPLKVDAASNRNMHPLRLHLRLQEMTEAQRQELRVMAGADIAGTTFPAWHVVNLGDTYNGVANSCVALCIATSASLENVFLELKPHIDILASGALLNVTPSLHGPPESLKALDYALTKLGLGMGARYVSCLNGTELWSLWLGIPSGGRELLPICISLESSHCYLCLNKMGTRSQYEAGCVFPFDMWAGAKSLKKPSAKACEEPARCQKVSYDITKKETHDGDALSRADFVKRLRRFATETRPQPTSIKVKANDWRRKMYHYVFQCISCANCPWRGYGSYDPQSKHILIKALSLKKHSEKPNIWGKGSLTQPTKDRIRAFVHGHKGQVRIQQVMQAGSGKGSWNFIPGTGCNSSVFFFIYLNT